VTLSIIEIAYLIAAVLFILGLRGLRAPESARQGIVMLECGMLIAISGTLLHMHIVRYEWIIAGMGMGTTIGVAMAVLIPMTKMPERIALSHAFGGLAAALVGSRSVIAIQGCCQRQKWLRLALRSCWAPSLLPGAWWPSASSREWLQSGR